jgi:hypothetical protein
LEDQDQLVVFSFHSPPLFDRANQIALPDFDTWTAPSANKALGRVIFVKVDPESVLTSMHDELKTFKAITDPSALIATPVLSGAVG